MKYAAFSIDNVQDPLTCTQFKAWWNKVCMDGNLVQCVGKYKDDIEYSFIALTSDVKAVVEHTQWMKNQESILLFSENNNQSATLRYLDGQTDEVVGHLQYVDKQTALRNTDGWTYRPDLDKYWIITVSQDEKRRAAALAAWQYLHDQLLDRRGQEAADALADAFGFAPIPKRSVKIEATDDTGTCVRIVE